MSTQVPMSITVSERDYTEALRSALQIARTTPRPWSRGVEAIAAYLAWTFDATRVQAKTETDMLELLQQCDVHAKQLALTLLVGRLSFGRPSLDDPRREEIERFYFEYTR